MIWKLTIYAQQYRIYFEQVNQRALTLYSLVRCAHTPAFLATSVNSTVLGSFRSIEPISARSHILQAGQPLGRAKFKMAADAYGQKY